MPDQFEGPRPEWAPDTSLLIGWPDNPNAWGHHLDAAQADITRFIQYAHGHGTKLIVCCGTKSGLDAAQAVSKHLADFWKIPMGDVWLRDTGPVFTQHHAHCFGFNGWGGKYLMEGDAHAAEAIAARRSRPRSTHTWVLEGGAIECDGAGTLITTEQCLLNPNRGPKRDKRAVEAWLKADLGVRRIIWLKRGLIGDHTDGHIDNIARFVGPEHVLCQRASGRDDPNKEIYDEVYTDLSTAGLKVSTLPSPGLITDSTGAIAPASHLNFVLLSKAIIFPVFEVHHASHAAAQLAKVFPDKVIIACHANGLLEGGGGFHCASLHIPEN